MSLTEYDDGLAPLEGIRVLDLSMYLAGPYGSMLLGDMGADVIKVEPISGDANRSIGNKSDGVSLFWASVNRNKRSLSVDLKSTEGLEIVRELAAKCDVFYSNFRPGVLSRLGLSVDVLHAANPQLVIANLTGYGEGGPLATLPAFDTAIQGITGGISVTGYADMPPVRAGIPIADLCGGMFLALGVLAALQRRHKTGKGSIVDTSLFEGQLSMMSYWAAIAMNLGEIPPPQQSGNSVVVPYGAFKASDGYFLVALLASNKFWPRFCKAIGNEGLIDDPKYQDNDQRVANREELEGLLNNIFAQQSKAKWLDILRQYDVPCAPINNAAEAMEEPQVSACEMRVPITLGRQTLEFVGNPIKVHPVAEQRFCPPPRLGEHTMEVLRSLLAKSEEEINALSSAGIVRIETSENLTWLSS